MLRPGWDILAKQRIRLGEAPFPLSSALSFLHTSQSRRQLLSPPSASLSAARGSYLGWARASLPYLSDGPSLSPILPVPALLLDCVVQRLNTFSPLTGPACRR